MREIVRTSLVRIRAIRRFREAWDRLTSLVEKTFPSGVVIFCFLGKIKSVLNLYLIVKKLQRINNPITKERRMVGSPLYLMLGSLCSGWKWILFFVDQVNVELFWKSSLWITDEVAQFLSNEISKRLEARRICAQQVVRRVKLFCIPQLEILISPRFVIKNSLLNNSWPPKNCFPFSRKLSYL